MGLVEDALARSNARPVKRIDYARMNRIGSRQKAALTRAVKTGDAEKIAAVCKQAVQEWDEIGAWRDDWSRWQNALDDALPFHQHVAIQDL
jgi:hypothetical protein